MSLDEDRNKYDDIINLPHHVSKKHPQMPLSDRAAQFSAFAALTGHADAISETARLTDMFLELDEGGKALLDERLQMVKENLLQKPEIQIVYFRPDIKKSGGAYVTVQGVVKKIDEYGHRILFTDGTEIPMESIFSIDCIE